VVLAILPLAADAHADFSPLLARVLR